MESFFASFNFDLIISRVEFLGIDHFAFTQHTGLTLNNLQSELCPELISVAKLIQIAHLLDLDVDDMIIVSSDTPQSKIASPVSDILPVTPAEDEERDDTIFLRAVLAEHERFRLDELADILIWTRPRLLEAIGSLQSQLTHTSQRLVHTANSVELINNANTLTSTARHNLFMWRSGRLQLTPYEAQYLVHLVRNAIVTPLALTTSRYSHHALWLSRENELHDRHLINIINHEGIAAVSAHPDVLFGLRLISNPSSPEEL